MVSPSVQAYTHMCHAVMLVWGSLRLDPFTKIEIVHSVGDDEPMRSTVKDYCMP